MQPTPAFGYQQIAQEMMRGLLDTVANRPDLSPTRQASLKQTVVCTAMAFNPRDPLEVMLASQCVVYGHVLHDGARDLLRAQTDVVRLKTRPGVLSAGKMILSTLAMMLRMQQRAEHTLAFARPLPEAAETPEAADAMAPREATGVADQAAPPSDPAPRPQPIGAEAGPGAAGPGLGQPAETADEASPTIIAKAAAPVGQVVVAEGAQARTSEAAGGTPAAIPRGVAAAAAGGQGTGSDGGPREAQVAAGLRAAAGAASGPGNQAAPPDMGTRRMPLDRLRPSEQQEIRDALARMLTAAGHAAE